MKALIKTCTVIGIIVFINFLMALGSPVFQLTAAIILFCLLYRAV